MTMKRAWVGLVVAGLAVVASACSSGGSSGGPQAAGAGATHAAGREAAPERPATASDFERTCADGLGFAGLPAYTKAKGVHPAALMRKYDFGWSESMTGNSAFPRGWLATGAVTPQQAQLVVCLEPRTKATPAGKVCKMEDRKTKKPLSVTMYNTLYRVRVLDARSGKVLLDRTGAAKSTECPLLTFTSGDDDPTKYYTEVDDKTIRPLVKPLIAP
jgi:hypothetical protein